MTVWDYPYLLSQPRWKVRGWTDGLTSVHDCVGLSVSAVTTEVEGKRMDGRTDQRP